jgi:hypothetical protein
MNSPSDRVAQRRMRRPKNTASERDRATINHEAAKAQVEMQKWLRGSVSPSAGAAITPKKEHLRDGVAPLSIKMYVVAFDAEMVRRPQELVVTPFRILMRFEQAGSVLLLEIGRRHHG